MSRDFILVFSGGVVSLMTTLVVLFVMDYFFRRDQRSKSEQKPEPQPGAKPLAQKTAEPSPSVTASLKPNTVAAAEFKPDVRQTASGPASTGTSTAVKFDALLPTASAGEPKGASSGADRLAVSAAAQRPVESSAVVQPSVPRSDDKPASTAKLPAPTVARDVESALPAATIPVPTAPAVPKPVPPQPRAVPTVGSAAQVPQQGAHSSSPDHAGQVDRSVVTTSEAGRAPEHPAAEPPAEVKPPPVSTANPPSTQVKDQRLPTPRPSRSPAVPGTKAPAPTADQGVEQHVSEPPASAAVSAAHAALDAGMPGPSPEIQKTAADDAAHAIKPEVKPKRKNEQPAPKPKPKATEPMPPSFHPAPPETMSRSETDDETGDSNAEEQE